jgi:hypothetical protein
MDDFGQYCSINPSISSHTALDGDGAVVLSKAAPGKAAFFDLNGRGIQVADKFFELHCMYVVSVPIKY